jgi:hypothetical protein
MEHCIVKLTEFHRRMITRDDGVVGESRIGLPRNCQSHAVNCNVKVHVVRKKQ